MAVINSERLCAMMRESAPEADEQVLRKLATRLAQAPFSGFWCLEDHPAFSRFLAPITALSKAGVVTSCYEVLGVLRVWLSFKTISELSERKK
ncbi:hypothetical protein CYK25_008685 [Varibaculum cambriense]|nr:hypothetical protein CYK25_008685 [Varibaculum cambriense]